MKHRLLPILIVSLLMLGTNALGAAPPLYVFSLLQSESITSSSRYGCALTLGLGKEDVSFSSGFRIQHPDTTIAVHMQRRIHGSDGPCTGSLLGNLSYFSHGEQNGATSLTVAYTLTASTSSTAYPTQIRASLGLHGAGAWSTSHDEILLNIAPHVSFSVCQTLFDRLALNLAVTTDSLYLPESNLCYSYALSVALLVTDTLIVRVRPLVRLSDYAYESVFVTYKELCVSVCITDASKQRQAMQELGVWL